VWGVFVLVWVFGMFGLDIYWLFTESGLVRVVAGWQASAFGGWYPELTVLVLMVAEIAVLLVVKVVIEKSTGVRLTEPLKPPPASDR
jgi:hypothetical protein